MADTPQTIIEAHLGLVRPIACRIHRRVPNTIALDDLVQAGTVGLILAVERFDPLRVKTFAAYAKARIRGAILDHVRDHYCWREDCLPETVEVRARQDIHREAELEELAVRVAAAIARLSPLQQTIVRLRYQEGMTETEISRQIDSSPAAVSQAHRRAAKRLRCDLERFSPKPVGCQARIHDYTVSDHAKT